MKRRHVLRAMATLLICVVAAATALAGWPVDPAVNLAVADRPSEQVIPLVAGTSDGGCYIGWFDLASGNYDVYLQRLDKEGNEVWPHNGILISNHSQNTWICDWFLMADSSDNAVLAFVDTRVGDDWDVYAYRISPSGDFLWGADGVALTDNDGFEADPHAAETTDGSFVFAWSGEAAIGVQKVSADGNLLCGFEITGTPGESPAHGDVVATDGGGFIVGWMRDLNFTGFHDLRAQKYSADCVALWPAPVPVFDGDWVPPWYDPILLPDSAGGAIAAWHRSDGVLYSSFVQHLDADGTELFPHNGVEVSTLSGRHHIDPTVSYNAATGETFVFWNERNGAQSAWGIYGQKISAAGQRMWTDSGAELMPVNNIYKFGACGALQADGAMVFWFDDPTGSVIQNRVVGLRVDADGALVWPEAPTVFSSLLSPKGSLPRPAIGPQGVAVLVWWDDRGGTRDIYAQNANPNGSLGVLGDLNCDGTANAFDIDPFVLALTDPAGYAAAYPDCDRMLADCNGDGVVNAFDIDPFVELLTGP